jgi:protein-S-isoprenylcysteine O-methyltransferase Ste14
MPPTLAIAAAVAATISGLLLLGLLVHSIRRPTGRIWPPPGGRADWRFRLVWTLILVLAGGAVVAGVGDPWRLGLAAPVWSIAGWALLVAGNVLAWWGVCLIGARATSGLKDRLVLRGPYRVSRNPQYLGDMMIAAGFVMAADSPLSLAPALLAFACAAAAPFAEEPWLAAQYGADYAAYRRRVPRFLGPLRREPAAPRPR